MFAGQDKPGGSTWTQAEIDKIYPDATAGTVKFCFQPITSKVPGGNATVVVGDPVPLNGKGARAGVDATGNVNAPPCYVNWNIYEPKDFSPLNL